jgi:hypothetical protein
LGGKLSRTKRNFVLSKERPKQPYAPLADQITPTLTLLAKLLAAFAAATFMFAHYFRMGWLSGFGLEVKQFPLPVEQVPEVAAWAIGVSINTAFKNIEVFTFLLIYVVVTALAAILFTRAMDAAPKPSDMTEKKIATTVRSLREYVLALLISYALIFSIIVALISYVLVVEIPRNLGKAASEDVIKGNCKDNLHSSGYRCSTFPDLFRRDLSTPYSPPKEAVGILLAASNIQNAILIFDGKKRTVEIHDAKSLRINIELGE